MASALVDGFSFQFPATIGLLGLMLVGAWLLELIAHDDSPRLSKESADETSLNVPVLLRNRELALYAQIKRVNSVTDARSTTQ